MSNLYSFEIDRSFIEQFKNLKIYTDYAYNNEIKF